MSQKNKMTKKEGKKIPDLNWGSEISVENQLQISKQTESGIQTYQNNWKNLSLLQVLEQYDIKQRKKRLQLVTKIVHEFFLKVEEKDKNGEINPEAEEKAVAIGIGMDKGNADDVQFNWQEETPMAKALRNPIVIKMMMSHLNSSFVLTCRLVNKLWLQLCTEILSKSRDENEDALRLNFRYCKETGTYIKYFDGLLRGKIKTLDAFNHFLGQREEVTEAARSLFPCSNFGFEKLDLNRYPIKQFFQLQGSQIKGLRLGFCDAESDSVNTESFTDLLMNKTGNVECLTIYGIPYRWKRVVETQNQILNINMNENNLEQANGNLGDLAQSSPVFTLHRLRCLRIQLRSQEVIRLEKEIILSSPALKTVHIVRHPGVSLEPSEFDFLTSISKAHLITHAKIRPEVRNMEILTQFAHSQPRPQLTHLLLSPEFVERSDEPLTVEKQISFEAFGQLASLLLESSKDSLESFIIPAGKCLAQFLKLKEIPQLKKVRVVSLYFQERKSRWGWPIPVKEFNNIFQNAQKLTLQGRRDPAGGFVPTPTDAIVTTKPIDSGSGCGTDTETRAIPQISSLILPGRFCREFLNNLPLIFCNIVNLELNNANPLPVLPIIWSFTSLRLKILKLGIPCKTQGVQLSPATIFPGLDAAFTGFPEDACTELLSMYPEIPDEETIMEIRINPSILNLKYLEELHIKFQIPYSHELPQNVLTVVSGAYAFQRMKQEQNLQVHIETELDPKHEQKPSKLISPSQQLENVLMPLLPYARVTFTLDKHRYFR